MGNLKIKTEMLNEIRNVLVEAKMKVASAVNNELVRAYWNIGRIIVEHEQK